MTKNSKNKKSTLRNSSSVYKSKKLVQISLSYDEKNHEIHSIKITGDFFLYPEDSLELLETNLIGVKVDRNVLRKKIEESLIDSQTFGFDSESLTEAIVQCI